MPSSLAPSVETSRPSTLPVILILPLASRNTAFSAGCVINTSASPAVRLIAEPELELSKMVVRARVVVLSVHVPSPTSHALVLGSTIA